MVKNTDNDSKLHLTKEYKVIKPNTRVENIPQSMSLGYDVPTLNRDKRRHNDGFLVETSKFYINIFEFLISTDTPPDTDF